MPSLSLRAVIGLVCSALALLIAVALPLALSLPAGTPAAVVRVTVVCALLGIGLGLALYRLCVGLLDRLTADHRAESLRFDSAINHMSQGLCFFDGQQRLIVCNRRYAEMYGLPPELVRPGMALAEIVDHRFRIGTFPNMTRDEYLRWRESIAIIDQPSETVTVLRDGRTFAIRHQPMPDGGWVATHEDITERRRVEAQIEHLAHSDALTGLSNRLQYRDRLEQALKACTPAGPVALLCVDLDRFKDVNDTLGHPVGDQLLCIAAQRLRQCVRQVDLVARLGGDEFAIVQTGVAQPAAARSLAQRLVQEFAAPFDAGGHRISIGASVGVAVAPQDDIDADGLLKKADLALYNAKLNGRGGFSFFEPQMDEQARNRRSLESDLREAEARNELELHYQPIVSLHTGKVIAFEALLRWRHPARGLVMPDHFIPLAEETGLIDPLGAWALREAFARAATWPDDIGVAVNLSPVQLKNGNLVGVVHAALHAAGLSPRRVEVEITESVRLAENPANLALLHGLRALGVRICLDDFGVGYSSLSYLRSFPFRKIKIDRSFVRDVATNPETASIVRTIATLGQSLHMAITAEGVEDEQQWASVRALGCDEAQGYYISRPRPAAELEALWSRPALQPAGWAAPSRSKSLDTAPSSTATTGD